MFVSGFLLSSVLLQLLPYDPTAELPAVAVPPELPEAIRACTKPRAPGEIRIFVVGASLTAGYPYPISKAGYAELLGAGLRELAPERRIVVSSYAKPALDSPKLAEMVSTLLERDPSLIVVTLGSNEFANRIFSGTHLLPRSPGAWIADRVSRARLLWRLLPESPTSGRQQEFQRNLDRWVLETDYGRPYFGGLPVPDDEQELLVRRMRRAMRRIDRSCRERSVPLVFCVAVYGLGGFWPWGVSEGGVDPEVDAAVLGSWYRPAARLAATAERLARRYPRRADVRFLRALVLRALGRAEEARSEFERARDLDTVPMHLVGRVQRAIVEQAQALGRPCLVFDEALASESPDRIPGPDHYLDYGHLAESGHRLVAAYLAEWLAKLGLLGIDLAQGWRARFDAATARHFAQVVPPRIRAMAPYNIAIADGNFGMLFGNYREALRYFVTAFRGHPDDGNVALKLLVCLYSLAGRRAELQAATPEATARRLLALHRELQEALRRGDLDGHVRRILENH